MITRLFLLVMCMFMLIPADLINAAGIKQGSNGAEVAALQEQLLKLGYSNSKPDGVFGIQTKMAVKSFQMDNGLVADGIVGEGTWQALKNASPAKVSRNAGRLVSQVISVAKEFIGVPYVWGGTTPRGFDCSGFTQYVFAQVGINLPRTADLQYLTGSPVSYSTLQPGDLVYFSTYEPGPSHDGIYLGDGKFINATSSRGITVSRLDSSYWGSRYIGAKRIIR